VAVIFIERLTINHIFEIQISRKRRAKINYYKVYIRKNNF